MLYTTGLLRPLGGIPIVTDSMQAGVVIGSEIIGYLATGVFSAPGETLTMVMVCEMFKALGQ